MTNSIAKTARTGGILYLIIIVAGIFAEIFVRSKLIVPGDATATANNILASELRFRIGFAGALIMLLCDVAVTLVFYALLRPISKDLALLAAFFRLISIAIMGINLLNHFAALFPLGSADYLKVFEPHQLHALAYLSLRSYDYGYNISLVFFGFHCLLLGYLLFRSSYFSRILGVLLTIAGLCYITNSFSWFLAPTFAVKIYPAILLPCFVGELSLSLWLLFKRINTQASLNQNL
jgi:hypothetical protein